MSTVVAFPRPSNAHAKRLQRRMQGLLEEQGALLIQAGRDMAAVIVQDAGELTLEDFQAVAQGAADEVKRLSLESGVSPERADYFAEMVFLSIGAAIVGGAPVGRVDRPLNRQEGDHA
jgi:hypothetical protein